MNQTFMKEKPIVPLVLRMALPMVISMLINSLYNIVDSYFVAKVSDKALTALSVVFPLQNVSLAVGVGFGIGINSSVSYFLGSNQQDKANRAAAMGVVHSVVHGVVLAAACALCIKPFVNLFTDDAETAQYALDYFYIVVAFSPAITLGMAFEKILQATGKMKTTMVCMAAGALTNIVLDPIFIGGLGALPAMEVKGAALATGIGQIVSLVAYAVVFFKAKIPVKLRFGQKQKVCGRLYVVGIPAALNLMLPSFMLTVLNGILALYGEVYILILGVYYKLQTFIYFTVSGIVQGIRPLVGYNLGAGCKDRVLSIFKFTLLLALCVMAVGTILCLAMPKNLMGIFTDDQQTLQFGAQALRIICCGFVVSALSVVAGGTFEGMGKGFASLVLSLIRSIGVVLVALIASQFLQEQGVWHAFWVTELIAAIVAAVLLRQVVLKNMKANTSNL